ncbi:hypothetical protein D9M69_733810 [compost metagenome]
MQGLYEVREEARAFVKKWNVEHGSNYVVVDPNAKTLVPRCAVPLRSAWLEKHRGRAGEHVNVICDRSVHGSIGKWDIPVPVYKGTIP